MNYTKNKGITLIALIITVIIMLILAGVAISTLTGDNGLFARISGAADEYNKSVANEAESTNYLLEELDNLTNHTTTGLIGGKYNGAKGVNTPKIVDGLIPVTINTDGTPNIVENPNIDDWYSYTTTDKRWANAITTEDGTKTGKVTGYWVWIPRYAYQITSMYHTEGTGAGNISIKFLKGTTNETSDGTTIHTSGYDINGTNTSNAYFLHPSFQDGRSTGYKNGEWNQELAGFWVAKFPAGYAGGNNDVGIVSTELKYTGTVATPNFYGTVTTGTTEMNYPVFLPETYAYNRINVGDSFNLAQNLGKSGNIYGLKANSNSHQMKNSEWGAIAYLTQSSYGINDNIYINNVNLNNTVSTIYAVTGWVSEGPNTEQNNTVTIAELNGRTATGENVWYSSDGQKGSSTGNLYGIYDLSGCVWERVSAYILNDGGATNRTNYGGTLPQATSDKLRMVYSHNVSDTLSTNYNENRTRYGDAMYETSNVTSDSTTTTSWYSDFSIFVALPGTYVVRGGYFVYGASAGVFSFSTTNGGALGGDGFRAVLCVQ